MILDFLSFLISTWHNAFKQQNIKLVTVTTLIMWEEMVVRKNEKEGKKVGNLYIYKVCHGK